MPPLDTVVDTASPPTNTVSVPPDKTVPLHTAPETIVPVAPANSVVARAMPPEDTFSVPLLAIVVALATAPV